MKQTPISQSHKLHCEKRNHVHVINYYIFMQNEDFVLLHIFAYESLVLLISVPVI